MSVLSHGHSRTITTLVIVIHCDIVNVDPNLIALIPSLAKKANRQSLIILLSSNTKLLHVELTLLGRFFTIGIYEVQRLTIRPSTCNNSTFVRLEWMTLERPVVSDYVISTGNDTF